MATVQKIRWLGDRMIPGMKLTYDIPELHPSGRCLMLDFQVWSEEKGGAAVIRHTFYEKSTASLLVFHATVPTAGNPR